MRAEFPLSDGVLHVINAPVWLLTLPESELAIPGREAATALKSSDVEPATPPLV